MNKIYRIIRHRVTGLFVVVSELVGNRKTGTGSVMSIALLMSNAVIADGIEPSPGTAQRVYTAENGKTEIVDIVNPNAQGLSHNKFQQFNVTSDGAILNNSPGLTNITVETQLAGQILANQQMSESAGIILNEVLSTSTSDLSGFLEVAGSKANVVVANINGISCNGCGVINTDKFTLTTGAPVIGSEGNLDSFEVRGGVIEVGGAGLNATDSTILELIARGVKFKAPVNAGILNVKTGASSWDYATGAQGEELSSDEAAPELAIDSTALGGMYANAIKIIATENGVGVRMLGENSSALSDFLLVTEGGVELQGKISSARDLILSGSGSNDIELKNSTLTATRDLKIDTTANIDLEGGQMYASRDINIQAVDYTDTSTVNESKNNNLRYSTRETNIDLSGDFNASGTLNRSDGTLQLDAASVELSDTGTRIFTAGALTVTSGGAISLGKGSVRAGGDLDLSAVGTISTEQHADQIVQSEQSLSVQADAIDNQGLIQAKKTSTVISNSLINSGTFMLSSGLSDTASSVQISNVENTASGVVQSENNVDWQGTHLTSVGQLIFGSIDMDVNNLTLGVNSISQSDGNWQFTGDNLTLSDASARLLTGLAGEGFLNATLTAMFQNNGTVHSSNDVSISSANAINNATGSIRAENDVAITAASGTIDNRGEIYSDNALTLQSTSLINSGEIQATISSDIEANSLVNTGTVLLSTDAATAVSALQITQVDNAVNGVIQTKNELSWQGSMLNNLGELMLAKATSNITTVNLAANSVSQSDDDWTHQGATLNLEHSSTKMVSGISGTGDLDVTLSGGFQNYGVLHGKQNVSLSAASINNDANASISAINNLDLTATSGDISNDGALYSGQDTFLTATAGIYNNQKAHRSGTSDRRNAGVNGSTTYWEYRQVVDSVATMTAGRDLIMDAATFINTADVHATRDVQVDASTLYNQVYGGDTRQSTGNVNYTGTTSGNQYVSEDNTTIGAGRVTKRINSHRYWYVNDYFTGIGKPSHRPQITAGSSIALTGFTQGKNLGGLIQASNVTLTAEPGSASFLNDTLPILSQKYKESWYETDRYDCGFGICTYKVPFTSTYYSPRSVQTEGNATTVSEESALISANSFQGSGFSLNLSSSVYAGNPENPGTPTPAAPGSASYLLGTSFRMPTSPNGYFVANREPSARYLVELNPLFSSGVSTVGSEYLAEKLNLNTDSIMKRLGDASYEAYLVEQQLLEQLGTSRLDEYDGMANVMSGMMENAANTAQDSGLVFGQAPSERQLAGLSQDIIWMVETEVEGQKVLAPVVYLAQSTRDQFKEGGQIIASDVVLALTDMTNTGSSIVAKNDLSITATGDIKNISGTIKGGNVNLESTDGSIINETFAQGSGNDENFNTVVGKTAGIVATAALTVKAEEDFINRGATVSAGTNADLQAGGDIVFDTIENKTASTSTKSVETAGYKSFETTTTTTVNQLRSGLTVGGDLSTSSGGDTTIAGSSVQVGGDAAMDAGGSINIVSRDNSVSTKTQSMESGLGVGGGFTGQSRTEAQSASTRNLATTLDIAGDANLNAAETILIKGSDVTVAGDASLTAESVQIVEGYDTDTSSSSTRTESFLGGDDDGAEAADGSSSEGITLAQVVTEDKSKTSQRSVGSGLSSGGSLTIKAEQDLTLRGSTVESGGDLEVEATDINLLAAQNIETSSSRKQTTKIGIYATAESSGEAGAGTTTGTETAFGTDTETGRDSAAAEASASANAGAGAEASASGEASSTVDFARVQTNTKDTYDLTNTASLLRSGGSLKLKAENKLDVEGSLIEAENDVDVTAKDMSFRAAEDVSYSKTTNTTTRVGIYADAGGKADASANAGATSEASADAGASTLGGAEANASASAGAKAEAKASADGKAGAGIQTQHTSIENEQGSTTALVSSIKSNSGSVKRAAEKSITDQGTSIAAAENFEQSAETISMLAAENTQFSKTTIEQTTARVGVYAEADGEAKAEAGASAEAKANSSDGADASAKAGASASAKGGARVGVEASVNYDKTQEQRNASQAVVSNIQIGGDFKSKSSEKTVLQGTNVDSGGAIELEASELEILAARDEESVSRTEQSIDTRLAVNVGVGGSAKAEAKADSSGKSSAGAKAGGGVKVGVQAEVDVSESQANERSTTAVASNLSGSNISIKTSGKTTLEGTNLDAEENIEIAAKSLDYKAAQNTYEASESSTDVSTALDVEITVIGSGDNQVAVDAYVTVASAQESSTEAVTGALAAGGKLVISTVDDLRLEGTQIETGGDATIAAGGNVDIAAARNTAQSSSSEVSVSAGFDLAEESVSAGVGVSEDQSRSSEAVTAGLSSGGNLTIVAGKSATFEGADVAADGNTVVVARENVEFKAAENTYESSSQSVDVEAELNFGDGELAAGVDFANASERSSEAVTGSISGGNNLTIVAGNDASFEGTQLEAGNDANVIAGNDLSFTAARNKSHEQSLEVGVGIDTGDKSIEAGVGYGKSTSDEAVVAGISSGGNINLASGGDSTFEGTELAAANAIGVDAGGDVSFNAAESRRESIGVEVGISASHSSKEPKEKEVESAALKDGPEEKKATDSEESKNDDKASNKDATEKEPSKEGEASEQKAEEPKTKESKVEGSLELGLEYGKSIDQKGATLNAGEGGISIRSGGDLKMQGTQMLTEGEALLDVAGKIVETDTQSSSLDLALALNASAESTTTTEVPPEKAKETEKDESSTTAPSEETDTGDQEEIKPDESDASKDAEENSETESEAEASAGISVDASSDKEAVSIKAKKGVQRRSGSSSTQMIPGTDMRIPTSQSSDGSVSAQLPLGTSSTESTPLVLTDAAGNAVPDWVKVDPISGTLNATPPAGFEGILDVVVLIPKADGSVNKVGVRIEK